jgi:hypothetical protein
MLFIISFLSSTILENRRVEQVLSKGEGRHQWEGGVVGERELEGDYNAKMCTHVRKCKTDTC